MISINKLKFNFKTCTYFIYLNVGLITEFIEYNNLYLIITLKSTTNCIADGKGVLLYK